MSSAAFVPDGAHDHPLPIAHEHPDVNAGWLRPAVFGAMDGLISNCALMALVVGGTAGNNDTAVVLAGIGGMAAGALSMAAGEYTSVASQTEFAQAQVARERQEIVANPHGEAAELAAMYVDRGVDPETAAAMARQIHDDLDHAVAVHAMEEFGVDPDDVASPIVAAVSSFLSFTVGAAVPLVPFVLQMDGALGSDGPLGLHQLWWAVVMTLTALFVCGAIVARVTTRSWWWSGLRQMLLGGAAAAVTFLVGSLVGVGLG